MVEDRCTGLTDGTYLVYGLTDLKENIEFDTFDYNGYKVNDPEKRNLRGKANEGLCCHD